MLPIKHKITRPDGGYFELTDHGQPLVFFHFPKTGGTLLTAYFKKYHPYDVLCVGHRTYSEVESVVKWRSCFTVVREEREWLGSVYRHLVQKSNWPVTAGPLLWFAAPFEKKSDFLKYYPDEKSFVEDDKYSGIRDEMLKLMYTPFTHVTPITLNSVTTHLSAYLDKVYPEKFEAFMNDPNNPHRNTTKHISKTLLKTKTR